MEMADARTYRKCPKCGSIHYKRSHGTDVEYIHEEDGTVKRRFNDLGGMPWFFDC
jgi:hypothetical protein